jgi:hypothetical protein
MTSREQKLINYLRPTILQRPSLVETFQKCSWDENHNRFLVNSDVTTINFDKLTLRLRGRPQKKSADSLSLADDYVNFIEFKSGDQTKHENKLRRLISGVKDKINKSDETMYSHIFPKVYDADEDYLRLRFFLVVDSKEMGIDTAASILVGLSLGETTTEGERVLFEEVLPDLKSGITNPTRFEEVDVWYSELFEQYLDLYRITDVAI